MKLLIDGDILLHRFAFSNQYSIDWDGDGELVDVLDADKAKRELDQDVKDLLKATKTKSYVFCISSNFNFRYKVLPTYKHNRTGEKPKLYDILKEHVESIHAALHYKNLEADDLMGIISTRQPEGWVIASLDKDMDQIPGWHYNWNKQSLYRTEQSWCDYWFLRQVLTGDSTDGYKGCPGIGPKKADLVLQPAMSPEPMLFNMEIGWEQVVEAYEKKGLTEADALQQARVARILRHGEYDERTFKPVLWTPPVSN